MKILLIGPTGQVGYELRRTLLGLGEITTAGRSQADVQLDIADPAAVTAVLNASTPDIVVNAAAYTQVDRAEFEASPAGLANGQSVQSMAAWCAEHGRLLVHYSTDYVFSGNASRPYVETDAVNPINAYGRSKLVGEQAIVESGCPHFIFRTAWVYASRGSNFMRTMLRLGAERPTLSVVDDQRGAPTWARSLAQLTATAVFTSLRDDLAEKRSGIYHLGSRGETTWYEFALAIFEQAAELKLVDRAPDVLPTTSASYPTPAKRPEYSVLDQRKFEQTFGLTVPHWRDQLSLCLQDLSQ